MSAATIFFSDRSTLEVKEGDLLTPIVRKADTSSGFATMNEPVELWNHVTNGLVPSLLDVFTQGDFFYLNNDFSKIYNSTCIVRIVTE